MKKIFFLVLFILINTSADENCLSGKRGNDHLINQFKLAQANSPVTRLIAEKYNLTEKTEASANTAYCEDCLTSADPHQSLKEISKEKTFFKSACIEAAATIQTGSAEISCPDSQIKRHQFCFTKPLLNYQNATLSEFLKCLKSTVDIPITPLGLFEMYTLESGFKPAYTNGGGTGIGQLTGIFIKDLFQKHRGRKILESMSNSTEKSCDAAKIILLKDLQKNPSAANKCSFIEYGEGMERNILYSLSGLVTAWEKDIKPIMKDFNSRNSADPLLKRAQEKALLNAYGPGGRGAARAAFIRLSKLSPKEFIAAMDKPLMTAKNNNLTTYTTRMHKKQDLIAKKLSGELKSRFNTERAAACTE